MESISFAKLDSGKWGVRFASKGRHPEPGEAVIVRKANGESKRVTLGGIVARDRGAFPGPVTYYAIKSYDQERPGDWIPQGWGAPPDDDTDWYRGLNTRIGNLADEDVLPDERSLVSRHPDLLLYRMMDGDLTRMAYRRSPQENR